MKRTPTSAGKIISNTLRDQRQRFKTRYARCVEGELTSTGQHVLLWTCQVPLTTREAVDDMYRRLEYYVLCGVRTLPVIEYGVDRQGVAYIITQYKEVEPVAVAGRRTDAPVSYYLWQMASQMAKFHRGGIAFGDIADDSFLVDHFGRVYLSGIPAFGYSPPASIASEPAAVFVAPETSAERVDFFVQDIYSFGVYAHQLLTRRALPRLTTKGQLEDYLGSQLPGLLTLYQNVPEWSGELLQGTLRWDPERRTSISAIRSITGRGIGIATKLQLFAGGLRDLKMPQISLREVPEISFQKLIIGSSFIIFFIAAGTYGSRVFRPAPGASVDIAQSYDKVSGVTGFLKAGGDIQPVQAQKGFAFFQQLEASAPDYTIPAGPPTTELERFASAEEHAQVGQSVMRAAPERELVAMVRRGPELSGQNFNGAAHELIDRGALKPAPRLAVLTLMHVDQGQLSDERRSALMNVVDESISLSQVGVLSSWGAEDAALILSALAARYPSSEIAYAALLNLASLSRTPPVAGALLNLVKTEDWQLTMGELRAIAILALGSFSSKEDVEVAVRKLEGKISPLETRLILLGRLIPTPEAPWCSSPAVVGSCFSRSE